MKERAFEPDFPPAAFAETRALSEPADRPDGPVADLRSLDWASIGNDDSRDLDQFSVLEPRRSGRS
jgi:exoribonuclease R